MARMFAVIGNRPDLARGVLHGHADLLHYQPGSGVPVGWGVGFYQAGELLIRRRPCDEHPVVDLTESAAELSTEIAIGHIHEGPASSLRMENTQPFRYRSWLFAQTASAHETDRVLPRLLEHISPFLRPNVRGDTVAELSFYVFLSLLHEANELDPQRNDLRRVTDALRAAVERVDEQARGEGLPPSDLELLVSNGEDLLGVQRGGAFAFRTLSGRKELEAALTRPGDSGVRLRNLEQTHFTLLATPIPSSAPHWTRLPTRVIFTATRDAPPTLAPL